jgi:hypothetical protein
MLKIIIKFLIPFLFLSLVFINLTSAKSEFNRLKLDAYISVELPKSWTIHGKFAHDLINTAVESVADELEGIDYEDFSSKPLVRAVSLPPTYATFSIESDTLIDFNSLSDEDLVLVDTELEKTIKKMVQLQGYKLLKFYKTSKAKIAGHPGISSTYIRTGIKGNVKVILYQIQTKKRTLRIMNSFRTSEELLWKPVIRKIFRSLIIKN